MHDDLGAAAVLGTVAVEEQVPAEFVSYVIGQIEARNSPAALTLMLAIGSISVGPHEQVAKKASAVAGRLIARGAASPQWAGELAEPVQVGEYLRMYESNGPLSVLAGSFRRAGREHAFVVAVEEGNCGAAADIMAIDGADLPVALDDIRDGARWDGLTLRTQRLSPEEFRWYAKAALDARAVHDEAMLPDAADDDESDGPPYAALELLMRLRLAALPAPRRPAGARSVRHRETHAATPARGDHSDELRCPPAHHDREC